MVELNVIREATPSERKEMIELGAGYTLEQRFKKLLEKYENDAKKERLPFSAAWAWEDFKDAKIALMKKFERQGEQATFTMKIEDLGLDMKKYSDLKNWELLDESEITEQKLVDGIRTAITQKKYLNYKVKDQKWRCSVEVARDFKREE